MTFSITPVDPHEADLRFLDDGSGFETYSPLDPARGGDRRRKRAVNERR